MLLHQVLHNGLESEDLFNGGRSGLPLHFFPPLEAFLQQKLFPPKRYQRSALAPIPPWERVGVALFLNEKLTKV
jgi:hypothetical protein